MAALPFGLVDGCTHHDPLFGLAARPRWPQSTFSGVTVRSSPLRPKAKTRFPALAATVPFTALRPLRRPRLLLRGLDTSTMLPQPHPARTLLARGTQSSHPRVSPSSLTTSYTNIRCSMRRPVVRRKPRQPLPSFSLVDHDSPLGLKNRYGLVQRNHVECNMPFCLDGQAANSPTGILSFNSAPQYIPHPIQQV